MDYREFIDDRIQDRVWDTKVPLKLTVGKQDLTSANIPLTLYFSVPRVGYLANLFPDIMKNIEASVSAKISDLWLEYEGIPLKWQYPVGVLVDCIGIDITKGPVPLTIRVRDMKEDEILKYENLETLKTYVFQSLKESDIIKHFRNATKPWNMAPPNATNQMAKVINSNDSKWVTEWRKVMDSCSCRGQLTIEKFPTRLCFCKTEIILSKPAIINPGDEKTYTMKRYFESVLKPENYEKLKKICKIMIHGIDVEENMTYLYYYFNFCYMDNFLYISFTEKNPEEK